MEKFADLYKTWREKVVSAAARVLGSGADAEAAAEDVAERVFVRLWREGGWRAIEHPEQFFSLAGRNQALNVVRRGRKMVRLDEVPVSRLQARSLNPEERVLRAEFGEHIVRAFAGLPDRCGQVCELVFLVGLTQPETAARLGISLGAVEKQVARGRRHLGEVLGDGRLMEDMSSFWDGGGVGAFMCLQNGGR